MKTFDAFREYRHTGDFEPDAQKAYRIIKVLRIIGWIFLLALTSAAVGIIIWDKSRSVAKSKIEFKRVEPAQTNSQLDPVYRILSEQG